MLRESIGAAPGAHPRSRGEHGAGSETLPPVPGSSPLARGTRSCRPPCRPSVRLIPARAGNTTHFLFSPLQPWAHPRSRGEHDTRLPVRGIEEGSSPLARGTPNTYGVKPSYVGLIPARAGNTRATSTSPPKNRAHPRSRGEHQGNPGGERQQ